MNSSEDDGKEEFSVRICSDLVIEALYCATRNRMTKLEWVGRRFHQISEGFFEQKPFVRYELGIQTGYGKFACRLRPENMLLNELSVIPPFLRFSKICLYFTAFNDTTIEEQCEFMSNRLSLLNSALKDSEKFEFSANVSERHTDFWNEMSLVQYLQSRLLPICSTSRAYKFCVGCYKSTTDDKKNEIAHIISGLLEPPAVQKCADLMVLIHGFRKEELCLPSEEISDWLKGSHDANTYAQAHYSRNLSIKLNCVEICNMQGLVDRLKRQFLEAKVPSHPFIFILSGIERIGIEEETLINERSEEVMFIKRVIFCGGGIEIIKHLKKKPKPLGENRLKVGVLPPEAVW